MGKMTTEEKAEWKMLYDYVKKEVMGYDQNQMLSNQMVLRLRGLRYGKYLDSRRIERQADYGFSIVLKTFRACLPDILKANQRVSFSNEQHRFNYYCKIVESKLNDVYMKTKNEQMIQAQKAEPEVDTWEQETAQYKSQADKGPDKWEGLW